MRKLVLALLVAMLVPASVDAQDEFGYPALSQIEIIHRDGLGTAFRVADALYTLDGVKIHPTLPDKDDKERPVFVYKGFLLPGPHEVSALISCRGESRGFFTYLSGYKVNLRTKATFNTQPGETLRIEVVAYDKGLMHEFQNRPGVKIELVEKRPTEPGGSPLSTTGSVGPGATAALGSP